MQNFSINTTEPLQPVPKYFRIQQELLTLIRTNQWPAGSAIPSEADLCAQYQVSRGTIRRALGELERLGLILRAPGKHTRVNTPKIPLLASGFRTDIVNKGMRPGTRVLVIAPVKAPLEIAPLLDVAPGAPVLLIQRVISADDVPFIVESAHVTRTAEPISTQEVESTSLLELLPRKCHLYLSRAVESYEPILLCRDHARLLRCAPGDLGIRDQAVLYDSDDRPLYVSTAVIRGDKARIVTETSLKVHPYQRETPTSRL